MRQLYLKVFLTVLFLGAVPCGAAEDELRLGSGKILKEPVVQQVTSNGVVFAHRIGDGRALSSVPFPELPDEFRKRLHASSASISQRQGEDRPEQTWPRNAYLEQRREEIAANREAERQAKIAAARRESPRVAAEVPDNPRWNDLELLDAEFGLRHAIVRLRNHGHTSRRLETWDLRIVYSDGSTRTPTLLRPNHIPAQAVAEISFRVPVLRYQVPRFLQFSRGDDQLIAVDRNVMEVDFIGARQPGFRSRHHPAFRRGPPPAVRQQIRLKNRNR